MKLKNISELNGFIDAVDGCEGHVWLESPDGDKFNLKSKFSQYIALGELLGARGEDLELFCQLLEDEARFYKYFNEHPGVN